MNPVLTAFAPSVLVLAAFTLAGLAPPASAADLTPTAEDCRQILEKAAVDPKAVPKRVVDTCRAAVPDIKPGAGSNAEDAPRMAATDPCAGPGASRSVLCWGPWNGVAPAAGGPEPVRVTALQEYEQRPELADAYDPDVNPPDEGPEMPEVPELPQGSCAPGTPCGFATVVDGVTSSDDAEDTIFARFFMTPSGSSFGVDPEDGSPDISSVGGMDTTITDRPDDYENLRASGRSGDEQSRLVARIIRGNGGSDDGDIILAADVWSHGNRGTGDAQSGYFAWGKTISQAGLDSLNAGNATVNFAGTMSVDNATVAAMTVNFGANPTWNGTWTNSADAWSFGAGGVVTGADLISVPGQFTSNVTGDGNYVQGALVGEPGAQAITHIINVNLADQGLIKDVGLLREVTPGPMVGPE
jgi:hypothetical protein